MEKKLLIPSLSGLQYGYNTAVIAGALLFISKEFNLTPFHEGLLVATMIIGILIASFSGILSNKIGRKACLALSVLSFIIGTFICVWAPDFYTLLFGRFVIGLGCGAAIVIAPIYLVEVAPAENRGSILNLNQIGVATGTLLAYFCSYLFEEWRIQFSLALIPAIIQAVGLFFIGESTNQAQRDEASWKKLLEHSYRSRFKISLTLAAFQSLVGNSAVFLFAPVVFTAAGFSNPQSSLLATTLMGVVYLLAILISFWAVDRLGRRFLLFTSLLGMAICLFSILAFASPIATMVSLILYIAFYSVGMGPVPPIIIGEISPVRVRGHVMSLAGIVGWTANYFITLTFLPLMGRFSVGGAFLIYGIFCLLGLGIFYFRIPETKQKSLDEIEDLFKAK